MTQILDGGASAVLETSFRPCDGPLFVVGMFRSGTSLLYALLNQHPEIALMYEGDLSHLPSLFWIPTDTPKWMAKWEFWNTAPSRHKIDISRIPSGISDLQSAVREVYVEYARQKKRATVWGCKSPTYFDEISRLARTFPNARFIIIWRDLRNIIGSVVKAAEEPTFFSRKGMNIRVLLGYYEMKVETERAVKQGAKVHQIHYEELVHDPSATMQGICDFLGLAFDPKMAALESADRSAIEKARHHAQILNETRVVSKKDPVSLPPALEAKIYRYLHMWREQYRGAWPVYPRVIPAAVTKPGFREQLWDSLRYRCLQAWTHVTPIVFSLIPPSLWEVYRTFRGRPYAKKSAFNSNSQ